MDANEFSLAVESSGENEFSLAVESSGENEFFLAVESSGENEFFLAVERLRSFSPGLLALDLAGGALVSRAHVRASLRGDEVSSAWACWTRSGFRVWGAVACVPSKGCCREAEVRGLYGVERSETLRREAEVRTCARATSARLARSRASSPGEKDRSLSTTKENSFSPELSTTKKNSSSTSWHKYSISRRRLQSHSTTVRPVAGRVCHRACATRPPW